MLWNHLGTSQISLLIYNVSDAEACLGVLMGQLTSFACEYPSNEVIPILYLRGTQRRSRRSHGTPILRSLNQLQSSRMSEFMPSRKPWNRSQPAAKIAKGRTEVEKIVDIVKSGRTDKSDQLIRIIGRGVGGRRTVPHLRIQRRQRHCHRKLQRSF